MSSCNTRLYGAEFSQEDITESIKNGRLLSMEVEFSRRCNFNCVYCYAKNESDFEGELTEEEIKDLILQAKELGTRKIIVLGGEPMVYPKIMDMVKFIRSEGLQIEIFTNGTNMDLPTAKRFYELGVAVVLKMNTFDEQVQDMLSGRKGAYIQIQEALRNLKEAGYPSGSPLGISTIICSQNIDELEKMWEWLRDQNITPYFEMITPQGNAKKSGFLDVDIDLLHNFFHRIAELDFRKYGNRWEPQPPLVGGECRRHQFSCAVDSCGNVQPCVGVSISVGNIRERKLADIIRDSEVIHDLKNYNKTIKGPCSKCAKLESCYGCRGAAYQMTGDYLASDPLCWNNRDRQSEIIRLPIGIDGLLPHKPPMLMVNKLLEVKERECLAEFVISEDNIFTSENGRLDEAVYPEIISQTIAAHNGFKSHGNGASKGFLLGVKNLEIFEPAFAGDTLRISAYKVAKYGEFGVIKGEVWRGPDMVARGEIKVWHNEKQ